MATGGEIRSISRGIKRRDHRRAARLPLQLDGGVAFDEDERRRSSALYGDGGLCDQAFAPHADGGSGVALGKGSRSGGEQGDGGGNVEWRRESLRDLPRHFRGGQGRPSRLSSLVRATT